MKSALLALGGNLDHENVRPSDRLRAAMVDIEIAGFRIINTSRFYKTPAFPIGSGPDYVNAAIQVEATDFMTPDEFFFPLAKIELDHGRLRQKRWGGRSLDIDILAFDELIVPDEQTFRYWATLSPQLQLQQTPDQLIVPHPRLHQRAFVLAPLLDIAPDWHHPVLARSVREMYNALPPEDLHGVIALPL